MSTYQHILVGLDLSPEESDLVADKAMALAQTLGAKLSLAHVIEPLTFAYAGDIPIDLTETQVSMEQHAQKQLDLFAAKLNAKPQHCQVVVGQTGNELRQLAADINADLIVVGSHGRHGLSLILGSTASNVLRGANCDVLAIRI